MIPGISNVLRRDKDRRNDGHRASIGSTDDTAGGSSGSAHSLSLTRSKTPPHTMQQRTARNDAQGRAMYSSSPPGGSMRSSNQQQYLQHLPSQQPYPGQSWAGAQPSPPHAVNMSRSAQSGSHQSFASATSSSSSLLPEEHRARERASRFASSAAQPLPMSTESRRPSQQPATGPRPPHQQSGSRGSANSSDGPGRYSSSHMESSVTRLLVATKMLLEALTKWSLGERTESQVSDIYVRLGNDFNVANVAFGSYGIDMSDLTGVPDDLRDCLEQCLSDEASPQTLEAHLPRIREIIIGLLQGLKSKQAEYKQLLMQRRASARNSKSRGERSQAPAGAIATVHPNREQREAQSFQSNSPKRQSMVKSTSRDAVSSSPQQSRSSSAQDVRPQRPMSRRTDSSLSSQSAIQSGQQIPPVPEGGEGASPASPPKSESPTNERTEQLQSLSSSGTQMQPRSSQDLEASSLPGQSTVASSRSLPNIIQTHSDKSDQARGEALGTLNGSSASGSAEEIVDVGENADSSVWALKSRDALERRASKRFSAYTFNKMGVGLHQGLGMSSYNLASMANGGERASSRGHSRRHGSKGSHDAGSDAGFPFKSNGRTRSGLNTPAEEVAQEEKLLETPTRRRAASVRNSPRPSPKSTQPSALHPPATSFHPNSSTESLPFVDASSATSPQAVEAVLPENRSLSEGATPIAADIPPVPPLPSQEEQARLSAIHEKHLFAKDGASVHADDIALPSAPPAMSRESSSNMFLYLQLGRQTKRAVIDLDPSAPFKGLSTGKLRMLFMDKFSYSPGKEDFPSIYVKDAQSAVSFELEDLNELHDGSIITLNIEPLDQVKQHLDLTLGAITRELRDLRAAVQDREKDSARRGSSVVFSDNQFAAQPVSRLTDAQFARAGERMAQLKREMASPRIDETPEDGEEAAGETEKPEATGDAGVQLAGDQLRKQYDEVINVRRQLAIMSQVQDDFKTDVSGLLSTLREQAKRVRAIAATDVPTERNFIVAGKARLDANSQEVLTLVEDLLDSVDDLKADVLQRGVKPKPHTMKKLETEIGKATHGLAELSNYVDTVKPSWKKTWEAELQNIVDEQEFLNHQEGLIADLKEDHANLQDVFFNIQEVVKLRGANRFNLMGASQGNGSDALSNVALRTYVPPPPEEGHEGLSTVMMEVKTQSVDHEKRLKALQAAEKQRQKELRQRKVQEDDFQNELTTFVDGKALRKTGGYLETERVRGRRDKLTIQAMFGGGGVGGAPVDGTLPARPAPPRKLNIQKASVPDDEESREMSTPVTAASMEDASASREQTPTKTSNRSVLAGYI